MAHFFVDTGGTTPANFIKVPLGKTAKVGVWGAKINGQFLIPSTNDSSVAAVTSKGTNTADGMIRGIVIEPRREGNVMLEARLGAGGPVWAFTQVIVQKAGAAASAVGERACVFAAQELKNGVFEDEGNTNTGTRVDEYEKLLGMHAEAWCAIFVYWCFHQAAAAMGVANPMPRIASASALLAWGRRNNKMVDEPAAGDIMIAGHGKHVGLVVGAKSAKNVVPSIEGNTWSHGTADNHKDGVYAKSHIWPACDYIRL